MSFAEAVTWTLLILGLVLRALDVTALGVRIGGGLHGLVFLAYLVTTVLVASNQRWPARRTLLALGCAVIPWATLGFEHHALRRGLLTGDWDTSTDGALGRLRSVVVRRPGRSALALALVVVLVFGVLLWLGPPSGWATRFA